MKKKVLFIIGIMIVSLFLGNIAYATEMETAITAARKAFEDNKVTVPPNFEESLKYLLTDPQATTFKNQVWHGHLFWYSLFCGAVSILVTFVRYVMRFQVSIGSQERFSYSEFLKFLPSMLGWFVSASAVGYLAVTAGFLPANPQGAIIAGFSWPFVFKGLEDWLKGKTPTDPEAEKRAAEEKAAKEKAETA